MENRQVRGYAILAAGVEPKQISAREYRIPSQRGEGSYIVKRPSGYNKWSCTCPDFVYRGLKCKHIFAVEFWTQLKNQTDCKIVKTVVPKTDTKLSCPYCKSERFVKNGSRKTKTQHKIRYLCRDCKKTFIQDKEFEKIKATPEALTAVLDLYFKGVSGRKIKDHLKQVHGLDVGKTTIYEWIRDYMNMINQYTETLKPSVGGMWHTDEMKVKVKGEWLWLWNTIDAETRFMLANNLTEHREIADARAVFNKAKQTAEKNPDVMVTDGLLSYLDAFKKEYKTDLKRFPMHIAGVSIRGDTCNNIVERYHNTVREREKVMRGLKTPETAANMHGAIRNYYNYIRPHQGLNNATPAQAAGIELELGENRWMELLRKSLQHHNDNKENEKSTEAGQAI